MIDSNYLLSLRPINYSEMLIINVKENESIDRALKRFKKKFEKTGVLRELRSRTHYTKPSVKRRDEVIKARYIQHIRDEENN